MLKLEGISKTYHEVLFENVTFLLGNREKVGLVGLNGSGKSTLLKIIAGVEDPDAGRVDLVQEKIGYLPQEFNWEKGVLVGEFFESLMDDPYSEKWKIDKILNKLGMTEIDEYQEINKLSEGQKMKLFIAKLLFEGSTILLLDEPTNHLDITGILWFEDFVNNYDGICIIISHDRTFLNNTVHKIFELDEHKLLVHEGNYDDYILSKAEYVEERDRIYKAQEKKRAQLEKLLELARKIGKSRQIKAAKTRIKREVTSKEVSKYEEQRVQQFKIAGRVHDSKKMLALDNLEFSYAADKPLIKSANLTAYGKEKIWFYGSNGIGKTTLIKMIVGELAPKAGQVKWGESVNYEYFSQNQSNINMEETVEEYFTGNTGIPFYNSFSVLDKFLFSQDLRKSKLRQLSPGQRARLVFAVFAQHNYDYLILDEPTNHLDIKTKEIIEDALRDFQGGILIISHDRYFIESIGMDRIITLEEGVLVEK